MDRSETTDCYDVIILGAGAAGLMAALRTAELGRRVLLLEKNRKAGVKILMSGGTRCNITHATTNRGIVEAFGPPGKFLHSALASHGVNESIHFFEAEGVQTKVEETGKIFPVSNKATDVLNALLNRLQRSGAELSLSEPVLDLSKKENSFLVTTRNRQLICQRVILTTGGQSYPGSGTTGDGYRWARQFGHTIVTPRPALVPVTVTAPWVKALRGITMPDVEAQIVENGKKRIRKRGSLLFAHFGLSGPLMLDISRVISGHSQPNKLSLRIDFLPNHSEDDWAQILLKESQLAGKKSLVGVLGQFLPKRLAETLLTNCGQDPTRKAAELSKALRHQLVQAVKRMTIPVQGTLGFEKAEVTAGGISLKEVDSRDMQSKLIPGLYFAGEILDLDGPIGGYNFQAAWSTGWLAGSSQQ